MTFSDEIEHQTQTIGSELFSHLKADSPSALHFAWWDERILDWCMHHEVLKVQLFRFIDVLPMLKTSAQVAGHLQEYLLDHKELFPLAVQRGLTMASHNPVAVRAVGLAVKRNTRRMARRFIAGETPAEALTTIHKLRQQQCAFTLDLLGEATLSEEEALAYQQRYLALLPALAAATQAWPAVARIDTGPAGALPRVHVSLKLSALYSQFDAIDPAALPPRSKNGCGPSCVPPERQTLVSR